MRRICARGAHRHQDGDVAVLLHHHHHQRDQNVQRRHQLDQPDGDDGDRALHLAARSAAGGSAPSRWWRRSSGPAGLLDLRCATSGARSRSSTFSSICVHHVVEREHLLRGLERGEGPHVVDVEEAGFEDARPRGSGGWRARGPNGVSSPCGLITVTTLFSSMPVSSASREPRTMPGRPVAGVAQRARASPAFRCRSMSLSCSSESDVDALEHRALRTAAGRRETPGRRARRGRGHVRHACACAPTSLAPVLDAVARLLLAAR